MTYEQNLAVRGATVRSSIGHAHDMRWSSPRKSFQPSPAPPPGCGSTLVLPELVICASANSVSHGTSWPTPQDLPRIRCHGIQHRSARRAFDTLVEFRSSIDVLWLRHPPDSGTRPLGGLVIQGKLITTFGDRGSRRNWR